MAMNAVPYFPAAIKTAAAKITPTETTTLVTLWTPGTNGSKIVSIGVASDDTATKDAQLWVTFGGVDHLLGTKTIAITAGFVTGTPAYNFFDGIQMPWLSIDSAGQRYISLVSGAVLKAKVTVTMTAAKTMYFYAQGIDF